MASNDGQGLVRDVIQQLQQPISEFNSLLSLLAAPLDALRLLPPQYARYNDHPLPHDSIKPEKHVPSIQKAVLEVVIPTWDTVLEEAGAFLLVEQYFCPDLFSFTSSYAGEVASFGYSTIMSSPITDVSVRFLVRLVKEYPIDKLHSTIFSAKGDVAKKELRWEECVQNLVSLPAKIANHFGGKGQVPDVLEQGAYFGQICTRCEQMISSLSAASQKDYSSIALLMTRLSRLGAFPPTLSTSRSQPSFFQTVLPTMRKRLDGPGSSLYGQAWFQILQSFPSSTTLRAILNSLFASLKSVNSLDAAIRVRALVKREARLLQDISPLGSDDEELWECASSLIVNRDWDEGHARIFVAWISLCGRTHRNDKALRLLLDDVVSQWTSPEHIKHSLVAKHRYMTLLLLLTISNLPPSSLSSMASSSRFISSVGTYISQMDNSIRHYGMLVAEVVAQRVGKKLDFEDWEGEDSDKPWCRQVREFIQTRDIDVDIQTVDVDTDEVPRSQPDNIPDMPQPAPPTTKPTIVMKSKDGYDSDDSMAGYDSPPSSRSASPTPSELQEIENDPSLAVGAKKIQRPVYLAQLGNMIRGPTGTTDGSANEEADKIEMALNCAEELIRKKKDFGTELEENAVNIAYGLVGLQDNYNLPDFDRKRQNALNALVACCPRKAAPCIIEEFFKNQYSTDQRYVILNALALGGRELASLTIPPAANTSSFPSKRLSLPLHQKYITDSSSNTALVPRLLEDITRNSIERTKDAASDKVPEMVREKRLRVQKPALVKEVTPKTPTSLQPPQKTSFNEVAAQYFIGPLINHFWLFLRDEQSREERTAHLEGRGRYHGAGTGLILNPLVLAHFLRTLALLVHAAHNASEWLAVIAPDTLELAVTLGTRPVSHSDSDEKEDEQTEQSKAGKEASVLSSALELALVILDGCLELDRGRSISLEHTTLLMGAGEWAAGVLSALESGIKVPGGGGAQEMTLRRAASGVVLKIDEITSQWRRSMIDTW
ncbi:telomere binding protein [Marasmius crinis-equi]|uniref:Telomere binding protein n=1 Tax=Marasmius crinis-equi TaxID=585013 RepID=A0ABR3FWP6_9AGAR